MVKSWVNFLSNKLPIYFQRYCFIAKHEWFSAHESSFLFSPEDPLLSLHHLGFQFQVTAHKASTPSVTWGQATDGGGLKAQNGMLCYSTNENLYKLSTLARQRTWSQRTQTAKLVWGTYLKHELMWVWLAINSELPTDSRALCYFPRPAAHPGPCKHLSGQH